MPHTGIGGGGDSILRLISKGSKPRSNTYNRTNDGTIGTRREGKYERTVKADELERMINEQLRIADTNYQDIGNYLDLQPVRVTLVSKGTFERYYQEKVSEGVDMTHLKPPHMNAPVAVIERLLELSIQE